MELDFFSAFVIGLLGSGHCLGMCGGITTMLTSALGKSTDTASRWSSRPVLVACYNSGRILSYSLIGALIAFSGSYAAKNIGVPLGGLRLIAALFLILLGLYLGQWLMWLTKVESVGRKLWQWLSPLSKKLIPVNSPVQALMLGALWGWLPCGLVYSTLTWSMASADALRGAGIMFFFGLGTLPALLTMSFGFLSLNSLLRNDNFKKITALALIIYGIYSLTIAYSLLF